MPRRRRQPTADELALWAAAVRDAAPLDGRTAEPPNEPAPRPKPKKAAAKPAAPAAARSGLPIGKLDRQDVTRLRRGTISLEGRIDLHGLTEEQAHHAVDRFVEQSWSAGLRLVLVITGKGGVLRTLLPRWLAASRHRGRVLALSEASARHGGGGAYYLRLRRRR